MQMDRKPVTSSNLLSVGYDSASNILEIEFKDGGVYHYSGVPENTYTGIMNAPSKGIYLNQHVKGRHQYKKVR